MLFNRTKEGQRHEIGINWNYNQSRTLLMISVVIPFFIIPKIQWFQDFHTSTLMKGVRVYKVRIYFRVRNYYSDRQSRIVWNIKTIEDWILTKPLYSEEELDDMVWLFAHHRWRLG